MSESILLNVPDILYQRLANTAQATQRPLEEVILHALRIGSPPDWLNVPEAFQADLAALDRLDDDTLWTIARSQKTEDDMHRYDELLGFKQARELTPEEVVELQTLRLESDRFMLRKAHAAALLHWRGHRVPATAT
ncbi:MAG: hypothetical protein AAGE59_28490 [Cyanobacteria bacterium P01_F01_bin.86]